MLGSGGRKPVPYGHAACAAYLAVFGLLWAVHEGVLPDARAVLALCLLPALALAAILLDLADTTIEVRARFARLRGAGRRRFEGTRLAGILAGKAACWGAVPVILAVAVPGLWQEATGVTVEMPALQVLRNGRDLYVEGEIGRGFAARLAEALDRNPGIRAVSLDSLGGLSGEAVAARAVVRARGLDTFVEAQCHSACVDVFLGGGRREAAPGARFGLHHPGVELGALRLDARGGVPDGFLAGLPDPFRARVLATSFGEEWFPDPDELLAAGLVTAFAEGGERALTPRAAWRSPAGAYAALVRPSLLGRLGAGQGAEIRRVVDFAVRSVEEARPRGAFLDRLRRLVSHLALARVAAGSDADIGRAGALILGVMEQVRERSEAACGRIGAGADLLLVHGIVRRAGAASPVEALLDAIDPAGPPPVPAALGPPGGPVPWGAAPAAAGWCVAEVAFYRDALAAGAAGTEALRRRFLAVIGAPRLEASAEAP